MPTPPVAALAVALVLSGAGLLGGLVVLSLGRGRATTGAVVEGLTLGLVPTMVVLRLLPHVAEGLGAWAIVLVVGAFAALRAFDHAHHRAAQRVGRAFIYTALLFHSFTDGVGLAAALAVSHTGGHAEGMDLTLTSAFVVHRLPEGLFIATTLLPTYGQRRTLMRILGLFAATVAGGLLGGALLPLLPERAFDAVVALGLGAMLQLVVHSHAERPPGAVGRALAALALVGGVVLALVVPAPHDLLRAARPHELAMIDSLVPLFVTTAPYLIVALLLDALIGLAPAPVLDSSVLPPAIARGVLLGLRLPLRPEGIEPALRGLLAQGAPAAAAVACAGAAATLGLDALLISIPLLGATWASTRLAGALLSVLVAAALTGVVADRRSSSVQGVPRAGPARCGAELVARPVLLLERRGAWYLVGLVCAAALEAALPAHAFATAPAALVALVALALAASVRLPLLPLVPAVAVLLHKDLPAVAAMIALLVGPVSGRGELDALVQGAGRRVALAALAGFVLGGGLFGGLLGGALPAAPALHERLARGYGPLEIGAAVALALGLFVGLARLGPRAWLGQLDGHAEDAVEHHSNHGHA